MKYRKELEFLKAVGCEELPHSGRSLYDHLVGTGKLLIKHNRPQHEVLAGLFHSIYGTCFYKKSAYLNTTRNIVLDLIGTDAEILVNIFCNLENRTQKLLLDDWVPDQWLTSLRWIEYCNLVECDHKNKATIDAIYRKLNPWP